LTKNRPNGLYFQIFNPFKEVTMLKFYYHPLSPISRRVWIALLEKEIPFDPIVVNLRDNKQFDEDFLSMNPFHHVPVLVHAEVRVIESLAILDYLEWAFPQVPLCPQGGAAMAFAKRLDEKLSQRIAHMRMVQMVTTNELLPKLVAVVAAEGQPLPQDVVSPLEVCLNYLNQQLGEQNYFGGDRLNLADIVAGSTVPLFSRLGVSLRPYAALDRWCDRISERLAWQQTHPSDADFAQWKRWIQLQMQRRQKQLDRRSSQN
jgi:glutathione S-transferase